MDISNIFEEAAFGRGSGRIRSDFLRSKSRQIIMDISRISGEYTCRGRGGGRIFESDFLRPPSPSLFAERPYQHDVKNEYQKSVRPQNPDIFADAVEHAATSKIAESHPHITISSVSSNVSIINPMDTITKKGTSCAAITKCVLPKEEIVLGENAIVRGYDISDWSAIFKANKLYKTIDLTDWILLVPEANAQTVDTLVRTLLNISTRLNFQIQRPKDIVILPEEGISSYLQAIDMIESSRRPIQMLFVILTNNMQDLYSAVKRRITDMGIPSQCMLAKSATSKGLIDIVTNLAVQMCTKLGGEPWTIKIPLKNLMIVGYDVCKVNGNSEASIAALVSSTSASFAKYFSLTTSHRSEEERTAKLVLGITKCLEAYIASNSFLPNRIILYYRVDEGEGQLDHVSELSKLKTELESFYSQYDVTMPKFSFIVVSTQVESSFFSGPQDNPPPGTVLMDGNALTLGRYNFYLVSHVPREGSVRPTAYNVLYDTQGLHPDKIQMLTYKMCHLYFNCLATVEVPAPCKYANKLAVLTATCLGRHANVSLSNQLHFL